MAKPGNQTELVDGVFAFSGGVNMGVAPLLLAKEGPNAQLGNAINLTVRGDFPMPRPPFQQIALNTSLPSLLFQGASYYKPDSGLESIVVALAGRLFQIIPDSQAQATATIIEQTIPGDPNLATANQAWLWQAEAWIIWNDGQSIPIFFNQASTPTARRSLQYQPGLYTTTSNFTIAATAGSTASVTLNAPYTNGSNFAVYLGEAANTGYTLSPISGAQLTLQNVNATVGKIIPGGTPISFNPQFGGDILSGTFTASTTSTGVKGSTPRPVITALLNLNLAYPGSVGDIITISGSPNVPTLTVQSVTGYTITATGAPTGVFTPGQVPSGYVTITNKSSFYVVGTTLASGGGQFVAPARGATVAVNLQSPWPSTVPVGSIVFMAGTQWAVTAINNNVSTTVLVTNVSGAGGTFNSGTVITSNQPGNELPPGRMGAYVMGRNWIALPDGQSFIASDLVGYSSGTKQYQFRDAVLEVTSNTQLIGGGSFRVPSAGTQITAISPVSVINAALGQGPVQVGTSDFMFSCNAPTEQETWQSLTNPILTESLIGFGPLGQWSTIQTNGDIIFRAEDGQRSLLLDQLAFDEWGNVPASREMQPIFDADNKQLLNFSSAIVFDNRRLATANPQQGPLGVFHDTIVAENFDPLSSLRGKQPSVYDGVWYGLNILQLIAGKFNGLRRAFAICYNPTATTIELWEILPSTQLSTDAITWTMETPMIDFGGKDPKKHEWKRLMDGELYVDQIAQTLDANENPFGLAITVNFRPDYATTWTQWASFTVPLSPTYQPRMGLGEPPSTSAPDTMMPYRLGYMFQVQIIITGQCRFLGARFQADLMPETNFTAPFNVT